MSGCDEKPKPKCFGHGGISPAFGCLECEYVVECLVKGGKVER